MAVAPTTPPARHAFGLYLGALQLFFTLSWAAYVIFLPKLAAQAGIDKKWVLWILVLDQIIFTVCDWSMGMAADRASKVVGRLGKWVALVTAASCVAFLLLPFAAPAGNPWPFLALTIVWTATSSALRAPPLVLLGKHVPKPAQPWLASLMLFGLGVAGALSPYLAVLLREADPRLPFAIASTAVLAVTLGLSWAERTFSLPASIPRAEAQAQRGESNAPAVAFFAGIALLGIGFQVHFALNAAPTFLKFSRPADLEKLMPLFWVGFSLLVLPASRLARNLGGLTTMAVGSLAGAIAAWAAMSAGGLGSLVAAQLVAGGAWGCVLVSATAGALAIGHTGREGKIVGGMFSLFALATFLRIAVVASQFNKRPGISSLLPWAPVVAWFAASVVLGAAARRARTREPAPYLAGA